MIEVIWVCDYCNTEHKTENEAIQCCEVWREEDEEMERPALRKQKEKNCFNCDHYGPCHARVMLDNAFTSHLDFKNQEARRWTWAIFGYMAEGCLFYSQKKESDATNTK